MVVLATRVPVRMPGSPSSSKWNASEDSPPAGSRQTSNGDTCWSAHRFHATPYIPTTSNHAAWRNAERLMGAEESQKAWTIFGGRQVDKKLLCWVWRAGSQGRRFHRDLLGALASPKQGGCQSGSPVRYCQRDSASVRVATRMGAEIWERA